MNLLTIVFDSCRFDSYERAQTPHLDTRFEVLNGHAIATFTYPAHSAMFQGFYPHCRADRPLYNRFARIPFGRFEDEPSVLSALFRDSLSHASNTLNVPDALQKFGYATFATGGTGWFRAPTPMSVGFEHFSFNTSVEQALERLFGTITREPFYALVNLAETHRPFVCPWTRDLPAEGPPSGTGYPSSYRPDLHAKQIRTVEYLDSMMPPLFAWLERREDPTLVCLCGDHGEALGEDGCFGHGYYHPSVMNVPLAWSLFERSGTSPVDTALLRRFA